MRRRSSVLTKIVQGKAGEINLSGYRKAGQHIAGTCLGALLLALILTAAAPVSVMAAETGELPESTALAAEAVPAAAESAVLTEAVTPAQDESAILSDQESAALAAPSGESIPAVQEQADITGREPQPSETAPQTAGGNTKDSKEVYDALASIYADQANVPRQGYASLQSGKLLKEVRYKEVLKGVYSRNAVAALLDHGYYRDRYAELKAAGVLPEDYVLPEEPYTITRTAELLRYPLPDDAFTTCVLVTDSVYLQTYQLAQIADYHNFDEYEVYAAELETFEQDYVDKAEWDKETIAAYASLH